MPRSQPHGQAPTRIHLHLVLVATLVLLIAGVGGLVGYISFRNGQHAVNDVARQLRAETTARIDNHLRAFLNVAYDINRVNAATIGQGLLDPTDPDVLERYFWGQVPVFSSVSSIYFGNPQGGLVGAGREVAGERLYVTGTRGFVRGEFYKYAVDGLGRRGALLSTVPDFDAVGRPWYVHAVETGAATWSEPYVLFTGQDMAVAASRPVYDAQQKLLGVVSVDIFLSHISDFMAGLQVAGSGRSFIVERSGLLLASSSGEPLLVKAAEDEAPQRLYAHQSQDPFIRGAAEYLQEHFGSYAAITTEHQLEFEAAGRRQFLQVAPVSDPAGVDWLIVVVVPESAFMAQIQANNRTTLLLIGGAVLLGVVVGVVAAGWVTRPIRRLSASTRALARGNWAETAGPHWIAETDDLARSFNDMARQLQQMLSNLQAEIAERKQAQAELQRRNEELTSLHVQLVQSAKLAAIGELAAGVAHELNNPLTSVLGFSELLQEREDLQQDVHDDLQIIASEAKRARGIVRNLLDFSRQTQPERRPGDLNAIIQKTLAVVRYSLEKKGITVIEDYAPDLDMLRLDEGQIKQVVLNLISNAANAMSGGGTLTLRTARSGTEVAFAVSDTGGGIAEEDLPRIFDPFFTTSPNGTGLGLPVSLGIVQGHGGRITVETHKDHGSVLTVWLPVEGPPAA